MGLALSDPLGISAQGLPTVERRKKREDLNYLKSLVRRNQVAIIVVGNPINMDGSVGPQSAAAVQFAEQLQRHLGQEQVEVTLRDERLTSVEANRTLREAGLGYAERAEAVDQVSATILLENFLEERRGGTSPQEKRMDPETAGN